MSNDNLILSSKESKPTDSMAKSMRMKLLISGSLVVILAAAISVNANLFSQDSQTLNQSAVNIQNQGRSVASVNPIFKDSWEKKAFQVLENTKERELASVGTTPSPLDQVTYGDLEGKYFIRKVDGKITEISFKKDNEAKPTAILQTDAFLNHNLALFSNEATKAQKFHVEENDQVVIEKYELVNEEGEGLGNIQVLLDKNQNLLSMTVQ